MKDNSQEEKGKVKEGMWKEMELFLKGISRLVNRIRE